MKKILLVLCCLFLSGCGINQLAGRHYIRHPETKEQLWAPYSITKDNWDAKDKVWKYDSGEICRDIYLYPDKLEE